MTALTITAKSSSYIYTLVLRLFAVMALVMGGFAAHAQDGATLDISGSDALPQLNPDNIWVLELSNGGTVRILLRPEIAPGHVDRIKTLTRASFYDGLFFHRVIPGFMAQGGDPEGTGRGGSNLPDLKAEFNSQMHLRGVVSMARSEPVDSANSQFFIMLAPNFALDGRYTAFGRVMSGMEYVDAISVGEPPAEPTRIVRAYIESDLQSNRQPSAATSSAN